MTKTSGGRGVGMGLHLEEGLSLAPRIQNYLEENGIFTYRDLLYWTLRAVGEDSVDAALDLPVILPAPMQAHLREQGVVTLRDLLGERERRDARGFRRR